MAAIMSRSSSILWSIYNHIGAYWISERAMESFRFRLLPSGAGLRRWSLRQPCGGCFFRTRGAGESAMSRWMIARGPIFMNRGLTATTLSWPAIRFMSVAGIRAMLSGRWLRCSLVTFLWYLNLVWIRSPSLLKEAGTNCNGTVTTACRARMFTTHCRTLSSTGVSHHIQDSWSLMNDSSLPGCACQRITGTWMRP